MVHCEIDAIHECPQVGYLCVKWKHLPSKQAGFTKWTPIIQNLNRANWKHSVSFEARICVDQQTQVLKESILQFSVRNCGNCNLDIEQGVKIGCVRVNLVEFADTRTLDESKIYKVLLDKAVVNSTLTFSISMKQIAGSPFFKIPNSLLTPRPISKNSRNSSFTIKVEDVDNSNSATLLISNISNPEVGSLSGAAALSDSELACSEDPLSPEILAQNDRDLVEFMHESSVIEAIRTYQNDISLNKSFSTPSSPSKNRSRNSSHA